MKKSQLTYNGIGERKMDYEIQASILKNLLLQSENPENPNYAKIIYEIDQQKKFLNKLKI